MENGVVIPTDRLRPNRGKLLTCLKVAGLISVATLSGEGCNYSNHNTTPTDQITVTTPTTTPNECPTLGQMSDLQGNEVVPEQISENPCVIAVP